MNLIEQAKVEMQALINKSRFEKMVFFTSILTELLEVHGIKPIIVGGLSVEIYSPR